MARQSRQPGSDRGAGGSRAAARAATWAPAAAALLCAALLGWLQFSFDGLADSDSYFHARAAREISDSGFRRTFPQAAFSTWSERYSDKDLLFHVALIPFQILDAGLPGSPDARREDLTTSAKQAMTVLALAFFAALAFALRSLGARFAWYWIVLYFSVNLAVLRQLLPVRPGLLGATFLVLEIALLVRRKGAWLAVAGALHAYAHSSFVLLPAIALAATAAFVLRREPPRLRLLGFAVLGPAVACLLHPYFPNNLFVAWDQIFEVARGVWWQTAEIPADLFGAELGPTLTSNVLRYFAGLLPAACGILAFLAFPSRRLSTDGLGLLFVTGVLAVAAFLSERFLQFLLPVAVLLGARLWSEILGDVTLREALRRDARAFGLGAGLLGFCLAAGLAHGSVFALAREVRAMGTAELQRPAIEFLDRAAAPGDVVYHNFWWDFSALYHFRPDGRYVVALDPVFFHRHDPALFRKSLDAYRGESEDLYRVLREDFGARWVYLPKGPRHLPFFNLMRKDPRFLKAYEDEHVVIARLG